MQRALLVHKSFPPWLSDTVDGLRIVALIVIPVLAIWAIFGASEQAVATYFLVLLVAALAVACFSATTGVLSFGHVAFMGIAAHLSALLTMPPDIKASILPNLAGWLGNVELSFLTALVVTVVIVGLIALLVGVPITRLGGAEATIATLGLLIISYSVLVGARDFTRGSQALFGIPRAVDVPTALVFAVLAILIARLFVGLRSGLKVRAVREDEVAASAIGIRPARARLVAWTLSGAMAALGGVLLGHYLAVFSPQEFYFSLTFSLLVILIVGGFSSITGAVFGSVLVAALIEVLRRIEQSGVSEQIGIGQVFGLTEIGLSIAVLWVLYRHHDGLFGHRELSAVLGVPAPAGTAFVSESDRDAAPPSRLARRPAGDDKIAIVGVCKQFGGVLALDNVDLTVERGQIVGLIGPNGSGKTTLLNCIAGTHPPGEGRIYSEGRDVTALAPYDMAAAGIARTFQTIRLFGRLTVLENVAVAVTVHHRFETLGWAYGRARFLLDLFGIADLAGREARTLAYGQQRRLEIARAMALEPRYLLLDEPAAGMNEEESDDLLDRLASVRKDHDIGLLIVDHDLNLIMRLCDRIVVLNKGVVIANGAPAEVQHDEAVRVAYFGTRHRQSVQ